MEKQQNRGILAVDVLGVLVSRAAFTGMNPLALGFFGAAYFIKQGRFLAFLMVSIGMATVMPQEQLLKYIIIMAVSGVIVGLLETRARQASVGAIAAVVGVATTGVSCSTAFYYQQIKEHIFFCAMEGIIAAAAVLLFSRGVLWLMKCRRNCIPNNEQLISVALIAGTIVYSITEYRIYSCSIAVFLAYLLTLAFAYKYGAGVGAVMGTACGIALALANGDYTIIGYLCILGITIGMFREMGRVITTFAYCVGIIGVGLYQSKYIAQIDQIQAMLAAAVIFLILPGFLVRKIDITGGGLEKGLKFAKENMESITTHKLKEFSKSFYQLSKTFQQITQNRITEDQNSVVEMMEDLSSQICTGCEKCDICWKNHYKDTYQEFHKFLSTIEEKGEVEQRQIGKEFSKRCIHVNYLLNEGVRMSETARLNAAWQSRLAESREAIAGQLNEVAAIIDEFSNDLYRTSEVAQETENRLRSVLKANRVTIRELVVLERRDRRKQVCMIAKAGKGQCVTSREVAGLIGGILDVPMRPADSTKNVISRNYDTFSFIEDTAFKALTGSARVTKLGEKVSGDNFSILNLENGQMLLSLSDGMGTGVNANEESESVIELLEQFVEAGFKEESAIRLINSILVLKSENQSFSTIDLSMLNLYTGVCEFVKIGAAATFIKRDNWVEMIGSTTMPAGVFNQVDFDQKNKKLYDGDYVIMMTDGVLDCIKAPDKERFMQEMIMKIETANPKEMANLILKEALDQNDQIPVDDMTVLVAGIWKK